MMNQMQSQPMPMGQPQGAPQGGPQGFSAPAAGINLFKVQEQLKDMPQQQIMAYANGSNPDMVPPYIALGEMERRTRMAKNAQTGQPPQGTVKDNLENQIKQTAGIASLGNMRQQQMGQAQAQQAMSTPGAVPGGVPQPQPQGEPPVRMAQGGLASVPINSHMTAYKDGGIVGYAEGGVTEAELAAAAKPYVGYAPVMSAQKPLDPEFDEEGLPRSRDERARILAANQRIAQKKLAMQRAASQPSQQQLGRMEQFYKPRDPQGPETTGGTPVGKFDLSGDRLAGALEGVQNIKDPAERARAMQALQGQMATMGLPTPAPQAAPQPMPQAAPQMAPQAGPMPAPQGAPQPGIAGLPQAGGSAMDMFRQDRAANEDLIKRMTAQQVVSPEQQAMIDTPVEQDYMKRLRELDAQRGTADTQAREDIQSRRRMDLWQSLIAGGEGSRGRGIGGLMAGMGQSLGQSSAARMAEEAGLRTGALDRQALLEKAQFEMAGLQRAKAMGDRERVQKHTLELQKLESQLRERQGATSGTLAGQEMAAGSREEVAAMRAQTDQLKAQLAAGAKGDTEQQRIAIELGKLADKAHDNVTSLMKANPMLMVKYTKDPTAFARDVATETKRLAGAAGITMPEAPSVPSSGGQKEISWANLPPSK